MSPIESFIENLLEMRLHYQLQVNQCDRLVAHAQEQLSHVNALLVDEALDNRQFVENLLQMRSHYQTTVEEQKRHSASAKEQLVHINALLAEQIAMQHGNEQAISMQARAVSDRAALQEATEARELPTTDPLESTPAAQEEVVEAPSNHQPTSAPEQTSSAVIPQGEHREELIENQQQSSIVNELLTLKVEKAPPANQVSTNNQPKTPLLPQYQHFSRSAAVEKLLQENIGTILHTDYIVRSLYGNLEPEVFKVEKQRLYKTLGKGVSKGLWDKVPDQPGCYTIDLKLVEREVQSTKTTSSQALTPKEKGTLKLLPPYQHLNYTQAVATVLKENAGQNMDSEKVARTLYGDLEAKDLTEAKHKIGKILWTGARQKRWQPVALKLGFYTMASTSAK